MMICVLSGRTLIHWNIPSYNALQNLMLNFIMKSYQGLMCPKILPQIFSLRKFCYRNISLVVQMITSDAD